MGKRFVIIAARRTGSNWLCARLRGQPDIWCHGEVFHPERVWIRSPNNDDPFGEKYEAELHSLRTEHHDEFLNRIFELSFGRENVGFKVFPEHGDDEAIRLAEDAKLAKIILYRENFLAVYASLLAAFQTGAYSAAEMLRVKRPAVTFSKAQFLDWHSAYTEFYSRILERLRATGQGFHLIRYDELNSDYHFIPVLRFLGAAPDSVSIDAPSVRGSSDILSRFSNPEAVEAHLLEHGLMRWAREQDAKPVVR
jgi:LPS sulfotransferase NodH